MDLRNLVAAASREVDDAVVWHVGACCLSGLTVMQPVSKCPAEQVGQQQLKAGIQYQHLDKGESKLLFTTCPG